MNMNKMTLKKWGRDGREGGTVTIYVEEIDSISSYDDRNDFGSIIYMKSGVKHSVGESPMDIELKIAKLSLQLPKAEVMTLRDHFAAAAIPALIASLGNIRLVASRAYQIADQMMYERDQKGGES